MDKKENKRGESGYIIAYNANSYFLLSLFALCIRKKIKFIGLIAYFARN